MWLSSVKLLTSYDETAYNVNISFIFVRDFCLCETHKFAKELFQHVLDNHNIGSFDNSVEAWLAVSTSEVSDKNVKQNRTFEIPAIFNWIGFVRQKTTKIISGLLFLILSTWITNVVQSFKKYFWFLKYFGVKKSLFCWTSFSSWWASATNLFSAAMRFSFSTFNLRIVFNTKQLLDNVKLNTKNSSIFYGV